MRGGKPSNRVGRGVEKRAGGGDLEFAHSPASFKFAIADSMLSPWLATSSSGQSAIYSGPSFSTIASRLGCCKPDFGYIAEIYALLRLPQIVVILHGKPTLGRAAKRLGKPQRHFGADAASAG